MSESKEHQYMVTLMIKLLRGIDPNIQVHADISDSEFIPRPPKIAGHVPDVYGLHKLSRQVYICEAKSANDLETPRSISQISAFISSIEQKPDGVFILGVLGDAAVRGKTVLRFMVKERVCVRRKIRVFDGMDVWRLDEHEGKVWLLC